MPSVAPVAHHYFSVEHRGCHALNLPEGATPCRAKWTWPMVRPALFLVNKKTRDQQRIDFLYCGRWGTVGKLAFLIILKKTLEYPNGIWNFNKIVFMAKNRF
jgi:hypothetical protein